MPPAHLVAAGKRLEYLWAHRRPAGDEPVLVFLHEGLGCIAMWRDFPDMLSARLDMPGLVYSRAGYGGSDPVDLPRPITYQEDEARDALGDVLDALDIRRAILIGHSDGGTIALIHAGLDAAGRILGVVTMAAHVFNEQICVDGIREARAAWERTDLRAKLKRYHGDNVDIAFHGWNDTWLRDDYWHWNVEKYLPAIRCPLLVMQGLDDHYGSERQVDAIVAGAGAAAEKLMLADCGHNPHLEQPAAASDAITRFVHFSMTGAGAAAKTAPGRFAMTTSVFIDGAEGTTGLQIRTRLEGRDDVSLLTLPDAERKDADRRRAMLNACDVAILCLPDDAARDAVAMIDNPEVRVIDASTAHRCADGWDYGFPEMDAGHAAVIAASKRVANTGCYAVASVAMLRPLIEDGLLPADWPVSINAVSGYSGGGKKMIASFENPDDPNPIDTPVRVYGLSLAHKHVPEIQHWSGLAGRPIFVPSVGRYRQGMIVQVPLALAALPGAPTPADVHDILASHYEGRRFVTVADLEGGDRNPVLDPEDLNGSNDLRLHVYGHADGTQAVVAGVLDNLGKGASGQAVQCLNLMIGAPEEAGLTEPLVL